MTGTRRATSPTHRRLTPREKWWRWIRLLGGAAVLAVVVWRVGVGPFLDGLRSIDGTALAGAAGIGLITTVLCAWRWCLVARGLGLRLTLGAAVAGYYGSQFLNTTLPGGVLGDVHRGVRHGQGVEKVGRSLRAVGWERTAGLVVHFALTLVVLLVLPSPIQSWMPAVAIILVFAALTAVAAGRRARARTSNRSTRWERIVGAVLDDVHDGLLARASWPKILLASCLVVVGHTVMFLVAARTAGSTGSMVELLPLALLILSAMVVPLTIGGWGPREGVAAWAFGSAGLGAAQGVAAATVYGVMTLVATLPGIAVLIARSLSGWTDRGRGSYAVASDAAISQGGARG
jgi:glycosyltransferase 2 family protein